jgi:hypothetical protein
MKDKVKSTMAQDVEEVFDATYMPKNPEDARKEIIFAQGDTLTVSSVSARNRTHHCTTNRFFKLSREHEWFKFVTQCCRPRSIKLGRS